jgi:hypothetical protein
MFAVMKGCMIYEVAGDLSGKGSHTCNRAEEISKAMRTTIRILIAAILMMAALFVTSLAFAQEGDTITYDQVVSGEITEEQQEIRYTFNGEANDTITISMRATEESLDSYLRLLNAAGDELIFDDDSGGSLNSLIGPYMIPETGTYTIVATRCCGGGPGGSTGPFELVIQRAEVKTLVVGETVTVQLSDENSFANYFIASDGDGQILRINGDVTTENTNFSLNVRNPHGEYVGWGAVFPSGIASVEPLILREAGSYILNLRYEPLGDASDANLPVVVDVTLETLEAQSFAFGEAQNGVLSDETPAFWFTFAADQSDLMRFVASMQTDDQPFEVQFFDAMGQGFYSGSNAYGTEDPLSFTLDPIQFNGSGQNLFVIRRVDTTGTGEMGTTHFTFTLSQTETPILQSGVEATGAVGGQAYEQVYRFEGQAGQTIRITLRNVNEHYAPSMDVTGPRSEAEETAYNLGIGGGGGGGFNGLVLNLNSGLPATNIYETTLQVNGTYLFRVRNGIPYMQMEMQPEGQLPEQPMGEFGLTVEIIE